MDVLFKLGASLIVGGLIGALIMSFTTYRKGFFHWSDDVGDGCIYVMLAGTGVLGVKLLLVLWQM